MLPILTFLAGAFYHFGIVKALKDNYDCELFAIIDVDDKPKKFFEKQKLVKFEKIWYYREHVSLDTKNPDMNYLKSFEEKYRINLWNLAYSERFFYKYNLYNFNHEQINSILEQECKLFENVIDEVKPDFLIIGTTDLHHNHLLSELCKAKNVKVLMLGGSRFGYRELICEENDKINSIVEPKLGNNKKIGTTFEEMREYLQKFDNKKQIAELRKNLKVSTREKLRKIVEN